MTINKHGMKMTGLKQASENTINYRYPDYYDHIYYNTETGKVWTVFVKDPKTHIRYNEPEIMYVGAVKQHMTPQEIADMVYQNRTELLKYNIQ